MKKFRFILLVFAIFFAVSLDRAADAAGGGGFHGGGGGGGFHGGGGGGFHGGGGGFHAAHGGGGFHGGHGHDGHGHGSVSVFFWGDPFYYPYYYYPYPYYPSTVVVPQEPQEYIQQTPEEPSYWYYCRERNGYYPYVKRCPSGWLKVVPTPPPQ